MLLVIFILSMLVLLTFVVCNVIVWLTARGKIYKNHNDIVFNEYGLLLGTLPLRYNGEQNKRLLYRVESTVELIRNGKISRIIVSGGTNVKGQNEIEAMTRLLESEGITDDVMEIDPLGLRTYESLKNAKDKGIGKLTVVSQYNHCQRALFIAKSMGMDCVGFAAKNVYNNKSLIMLMREALARVKMFVDITFRKR